MASSFFNSNKLAYLQKTYGFARNWPLADAKFKTVNVLHFVGGWQGASGHEMVPGLLCSRAPSPTASWAPSASCTRGRLADLKTTGTWIRSSSGTGSLSCFCLSLGSRTPWGLSTRGSSYHVPEFIDPVFTKTSPKRSFSVIENERIGLVFAKTGSINSGTGVFSSCLVLKHFSQMARFPLFTKFFSNWDFSRIFI